MSSLTDTAVYPAYATKKAMLKALQEAMEPNVPNCIDILARISNTDFNALSDKSTVFNSADTWEAKA